MILIKNAPPEDLTPKTNALHEAAHAVIAIHRKCIVKSVSINSVEEQNGTITAGYTEFYRTAQHSWLFKTTKHIDDFAFIACAGSVIENVNYINDMDYNLFKRSGYKKKDLSIWFGLTSEILQDKKVKKQIKIISKELLKRGELNGKEIEELI